MTSLLQMKAQFESLTNQYDENLAEIDACAARHDEGMLSGFCLILFLPRTVLFVSIRLLIPPLFSNSLFRSRRTQILVDPTCRHVACCFLTILFTVTNQYLQLVTCLCLCS